MAAGRPCPEHRGTGEHDIEAEHPAQGGTVPHPIDQGSRSIPRDCGG
jgi:hypothetical protein